jgi:hypothetical protein
MESDALNVFQKRNLKKKVHCNRFSTHCVYRVATQKYADL